MGNQLSSSNRELKAVEAVNKLKSEWDIVGMPKQNYTPQVGEECEALWLMPPDGGSPEWRKIRYKAIYADHHWINDGSDSIIHNASIQFRPLKTERDKLLEHAVSDIVGDSKTEHVSLKDSEQIGKLIDAGWRPTNDN